jgi:pimeloyl-ACP methyl ester carboxylesterase
VRAAPGLRRPGRHHHRVGGPAIRRLIPSLLAAVALLTAGCSGASNGPAVSAPVTSSPNSAGAPAALARFYGQHLVWTSCATHFQCATLTVPVDYSRPRGATIGIAVVRKPATGSANGSLIVNPGGPGASGIDFVEQDANAFADLTSHENLVSFDPRGVGQSHPVRCVTSAQLDTFINTNPDPTTSPQLAAVVATDKAFANACYAKNGSFLEHVGTIDQARDMDVLRAALGDSKLTYYGASYGTYLGAKYAQLFPTRIRAMVLDGALDPSQPATAENRVQADGFQTDLDDFLTSCTSKPGCPLGSSKAAALSKLHALEARITQHPIAVGARTLGPGEFFEGLASGLYSPTDWTEFGQAIGQAMQGNGTYMLAFADNLTERQPDGSYTNLVESNLAINCIDRPWPRKVASYVQAARTFARAAPDFGAAIEYGSLPCAFWRVPPVEKTHQVTALGSPPILVIGTTRDPATPYVWAQALARQLSKGVLLTYQGDGHTAALRGDSCVDSVVRNYVLSLQTPAAGTRCS